MRNETLHILMVEDDAVQLRILEKALLSSTETPLKLKKAEDLRSAFKVLDRDPINVVLLDLNLPDSYGIDTVLKMLEHASDVPIVVMTGDDDSKTAIEALRKGAQDYLVKGQIHEKMIMRTLQYAVERKSIEVQLKYANERLEQSNRELRSTQLQLIQAAKMDVIGRLAAGVAHEVKNPLSMITMGIDFLEKEVAGKDEKAVFMVRSMAEAVRRADTVIREMLDFSSPQELTLRPEDLGEIVERSLLLVKHELDSNQIKLNLHIDKGLPKVEVDRKQMEQVFINLYTNAVRAMGQGGELTIKAYSEKLLGFSEGVGYRKDDILTPGDKVAVIQIEDTGPGIPQDLIYRVFDPFFTTSRDKGGTGLGLSLVKTMIQMHHGLIRLENRSQGGARAIIKLRAKEE